jgi:predicted RNA-binding Zn-ribbon protein involved in translation (DUF1610 family)
VSERPYRETVGDQPDPYLVAWEQLFRRRTKLLLTFFTWTFVASLVLTLAMTVLGVADRALALYVALSTSLIALALASFYAHFECPQCGTSINRRRRVSNPFSDECQNCGIRMGTPKFVPRRSDDDAAIR